MVAKFYNPGLRYISDGTVDLDTDPLIWILCTSSYTFNDEHEFVDDLTNELSGGNYSRPSVTGVNIAKDDVNDGADIEADDPTFPSLGAAAGTPDHLILAVNVGTDATNILICALDLLEDAPDGNDYVCNLSGGKIGHWRNAAGAGVVGNQAIVDILTGALDLDDDTLQHGLHTSSYTPDPDDQVDADLTNELSGGNYGEVVAAGKTVELDNANNGCYFDVTTNPTFTSLEAGAGTPAYMVTRRPSADRFICANPLTTPDTPNGNNYVCTPAAAGLITVRNSAS